MFFPTIFSFAILVATAAADLHDSCICINGEADNLEMTTDACTAYNTSNYEWGKTTYDSTAGRCTAVTGGKIAGKEWESACKSIAQHNGFRCPDGNGVCYASVNWVRGSC